jgi:5S rRNA maturation endonuclease (ribonuclease M5)
LDSTGSYARCTREDRAGAIDQNSDGTYSHRLAGPCRCGDEHGPPADPRANGRPAVVARYPYVDAEGRPLFEVVRYADKSFIQRRYDPAHPKADSRGYYAERGCMAGVPRVLFNLPAVIRAVENGTTVFVVEGEKDCQAVAEVGGIAVCNPGGAGRWLREHAEPLRGAEVIVVADKDEPGRKHATEVARSLSGVAASVRVVEAREGKDAHDHLSAGFGLEDFAPVAEVAVPPPVAADEVEHDSWQPVDILTAGANPPAPPGDFGLIYIGKRHVIQGEPESGKTWVALVVARAFMERGEVVAWIDTDDLGSPALLAMLRALGISDETIRDLFAYIQPGEAATPDRLAYLIARRPGLVVVDSWDPSVHLQGGDPNKASDINAWADAIQRPIRRALPEVTLLTLDHLAKASEGRGGYGVGSYRKKAHADVVIELTVKVPVSRHSPGMARIYCRKDRGGHYRRGPGGAMGLVNFTPDGAGGLSISIDLSDAVAAGGAKAFRPTGYMEKVSRFLEVAGPSSGNAVESGVGGKAAHKRDALSRLVEEGYAVVDDGPRGSRVYRIERVYREADEVQESTSSPPRPHLVRDEVDHHQNDLVPSSLPLRDEDEDEVGDGAGRGDLVPFPGTRSETVSRHWLDDPDEGGVA